MPQRIIDTHVHTDNSPDGHHSAMYMCECAEMAGLRAIAFTDHVEADAYRRDAVWIGAVPEIAIKFHSAF